MTSTITHRLKIIKTRGDVVYIGLLSNAVAFTNF